MCVYVAALLYVYVAALLNVYVAANCDRGIEKKPKDIQRNLFINMGST
jgi:hypothetical protein